MGPRHSKRSLDMAGTPTKSEIEGVGNVGKLEKIIDGIVEKVSANGHVDGELQNGAEALQNGMEPVQNGEAAPVSVDHSLEKIKLDEKEEEVIAAVNGESDEKVNGEVDDKAGDAEGKEDKKEKKKDKKEKVVKKKFSFRSFSFSKKDKSKPKEEKAPDAKEKPGIEESPEVVENNAEENVQESKETVEEPKAKVSEPEVEVAVAVNEADKENAIVAPSPIVVMTVDATVTEAGISEISDLKPLEKVSEKVPNADDLPPPLPASPPPTEMKEEEETVQKKEGEVEVTENVNSAASVKDVESFSEVMEPEPSNEVLATAEHIEEKATDLLKAVEEKMEECQRNDSETAVDNTNYELNDDVEMNVSSGSDVVLNDDAGSTVLKEVDSKLEESVPESVSSIVTMSSNAEETADKQEEFGAGESLAEIDGNAEPAIITNEVILSD